MNPLHRRCLLCQAGRNVYLLFHAFLGNVLQVNLVKHRLLVVASKTWNVLGKEVLPLAALPFQVCLGGNIVSREAWKACPFSAHVLLRLWREHPCEQTSHLLDVVTHGKKGGSLQVDACAFR